MNNEIILKVKLQNKQVEFLGLSHSLSNEELEELNKIQSENITISKKENNFIKNESIELFPLNFII